MLKKIYIRADGNSEIGMGHLVRCFSLAKMLSLDFEIAFCSLFAPKSFIEDLDKAGFKFYPLHADEEFLNIINEGDISVLDNYQLSIDYHQKIRELKVKLVCIDDINEKPFDSDLIINHSPTANALDYDAKYYTQFLLGIDFALLRPKFLEGAIQNRKVNNLNSVFICFGGADPSNYTHSVLKACISNNNFKQINVVTGVSYLHNYTLNEINDERVICYHSLNEDAMFELMSNNSLAIVPASGTLYEALAAGCLVMSGYYVENQKNIYEGFKNMSAFVDLNKFENLDIIKNITLGGFSSINRNVIDGLSSSRIVDSFKKL
jgi:UDP-2,4-diacetamido-2,4,6-trideoxy-beta-L-altropyranose hydrolase